MRPRLGGLGAAVAATAPAVALAADDGAVTGYVMVGGVALLVVGVLVMLLRSTDRRPAAAASSPGAKRRLAKRLRAQGQAGRAGDLFVEAGDKEAALDTFLKAGLLAKASPLLEEQGDLAAALEGYVAGRDHLGAARVSMKMGRPNDAAEHLTAAARHKDAAKVWADAGDHRQSGNAWWQAGEHARAAEAYQTGRFHAEAAQAYRYLLDVVRAGPSGASQRSYNPADVARRCAQNHLAAGAAPAAAEALALAGLHGEAAQAWRTAGELARAGEALEAAGDLVGAAAAFQEGGDAARADALRARHALAAGDARDAAAHLERSGDVTGAAALWLQAGEAPRAAALYERGGSHAEAGAAWERAGDKARAGAAWARSGDVARGADLLRDAGDLRNEVVLRERMQDWVRAGEIRLSAGDLAGAEAVLKQVQDGDARYAEGCRLLGLVYHRTGQTAAAAVKLRRAVDGQRPSAETAETFYLAGALSLAVAEPRSALPVLLALRDHDPTYKDVQARVEAAQRAIAEEIARSSGAGDRYERKEQLGAGGMGAVYRARDVVLEREVAFKVLTHASTASAREQFLREARSAAVLNHPGIVAVYDFGEADGNLFIAMELVDGLSLKELCRAMGPFPVGLLRTVALQACDALAFAHDRRVIHRDIKPANLMWTDAEQLKITDFGLAKVVGARGGESDDAGADAAGEATEAEAADAAEALADSATGLLADASQSRLAGTPFYISPEQIRRGRVDHRTDQYSLGVTLFEMATGKVPFGLQNILQSHLAEPAPPPSGVRPGLPAWLDDLVLTMMAKEPEARYADMRAVTSAIPPA